MRGVAMQLPDTYSVKDWSQTQGSLFSAVKLEKLMVSLLLLSVVAVAAFNIVSTLVMSVAEKRRDIAVLRTMGARAGGIMAIFVAHGLALSGVGITVGALVGVFLATNIATIIAALERALGMKLFDPSVYFISELPAELAELRCGRGGGSLSVIESSGHSLSRLACGLYRACRGVAL